MKRFMMILSLMLVLFLLAGCNTNRPPEPNSVTPNTTETVETEIPTTPVEPEDIKTPTDSNINSVNLLVDPADYWVSENEFDLLAYASALGAYDIFSPYNPKTSNATHTPEIIHFFIAFPGDREEDMHQARVTLNDFEHVYIFLGKGGPGGNEQQIYEFEMPGKGDIRITHKDMHATPEQLELCIKLLNAIVSSDGDVNKNPFEMI